jgi:hypothetical protein
MATIEKSAVFEAPGRVGSPVELASRYENFIGGQWVPPIGGEYSENVTPATGEVFTEVPRSTPRTRRRTRGARCRQRGGPRSSTGSPT